MVYLPGVLLVFSLIMITSQASAELKVIDDVRMSDPQKNHTLWPAVRSLEYWDFYHEWRDWYDAVTEKPFYLHVNDVFLGKLTLSRNNRLEISTPVSGAMMTRITFGTSDITALPHGERYNLGFGVTTPLGKGLYINTSVNFALSDPSDMTFWLTLPAIRF